MSGNLPDRHGPAERKVQPCLTNWQHGSDPVHVRKVALAARCLEKGHLARLGHASAMAFALPVTRDLYEHLRTIQAKGGKTITESLQEIPSREKESKIKS